jgi:hypothetical protein
MKETPFLLGKNGKLSSKVLNRFHSGESIIEKFFPDSSIKINE